MHISDCTPEKGKKVLFLVLESRENSHFSHYPFIFSQKSSRENALHLPKWQMEEAINPVRFFFSSCSEDNMPVLEKGMPVYGQNSVPAHCLPDLMADRIEPVHLL